VPRDRADPVRDVAPGAAVPNVEVGVADVPGPTGAEGGARAAADALARIAHHRPSAVLVFSSPANDLAGVLRGVRDVIPEAPVVGATTAGEIAGAPRSGGVSVGVLASPYLRVRVGVGAAVSSSWSAALDQALAGPELAPYFDGTPDAWGALTASGRGAFALLLSPGNTRRAPSASFDLLEALKRRSGGRLPIFGGSAADDWRLEQNHVLCGDRAVPDAVLVAVVETELQVGIALAHGFRAMGARVRATAVDGHELVSLGGVPAVEAFARLVGVPAAGLGREHLSVATRRVLGIVDPLGGHVPLVASYATPRGGLLVSRAVPEGAELTVLEVGPDAAETAAPDAIRKARMRGAIARPALGLVAYCALRPQLLGDAWRTEVPRAAAALGEAPLLGFQSFGEQSLADDGEAQHTNAVVAALVLGQDLSASAQAVREAEVVRARAREELERLVEVRTAELRASNARLAAQIEEREHAEAAARRHERAARTLGACNEALVRATDEAKLLQDVCRIIVEVGGYPLAWVGFAEHDARKTVRPVASCGVDEGYVRSVDVVWSDSERGRGPVGTAIRTREVVLARRISEDPRFALWRAKAAECGFAAMVALPLGGDREPIGALAIYAADAEALADDREAKLLTELADDLAFGIHVLRGRAERARMHARLAETDRLAAVGTLAAGVAHEINNPLSYLLGGLEHVERELAGLAPALGVRASDLLSVLGEMRSGGSRIRQIVRDLKTFSRADEDARTDVDLRRLAESSLNLAAQELAHRARVVRELGPVPPVTANEGRLGQVLLNLLVNAAQALPEDGAGRHEVRVTTRTDAAGRAVVEVSDDGPGIPPELIGRIFEPFFTTKPQGVGTGLGLWISRNIVAAAGGELTVASSPGAGATFRVVFPPAVAPRPAAPAAPGPEAPAPRARVLVVDDDLLVATAIQRALSGEHDVVVETSARAALARIARGDRFGAFVCDLMMPEMSGMQLHAELSRIAPGSAERVVFVTGGAFTPAAREYLEAVPNPRLEKPFDARTLRAAIRGVLPPDGR
jgi:signal transduction histidine kinase/CheY-like chemotaxis protein